MTTELSMGIHAHRESAIFGGKNNAMKAEELLIRVEQRMKVLGLNASQLGRAAGYPDIVKNIKTAAAKGRDYEPTLETVYRLAKALGVEPEWLTGMKRCMGPDPAPFASPEAEQLFAVLDGMLAGANIDEFRADVLRRVYRRILSKPLDDVPESARPGTLRIISEILTREILEESRAQASKMHDKSNR